MNLTRALLITFELPPELTGGIASVSLDKVIGFKKNNIRTWVIGPSEKLRLKSRTIPGAFFPIPVQNNLIKFLCLFFWLLVVIPFLRPQFIYSTSGTWAGMAARIAAKLFGIPYFVMAHGNEFIRFEKSGFIKQQISKVFSDSCGIMAVSRFTGTEVERIYDVEKEKVHLVYNGVNERAFLPADPLEIDALRQKLSISKEHRIILTLSRLDPRKGHMTVLKSVATLKKKYGTGLKLTYLIAGRGNFEFVLRQEAEKLGLTEEVRFLGFVDREDVNTLYSMADLFVMPSIYLKKEGSVEGFGLVYVEAGLCSTPSLGGVAGGVSDAIVDGKTGYVVDGTDNNAVTDIIEDCLMDQEKYEQMGIAARSYYSDHLTLDHVISNELQVIQRLIGKGMI